MFKPNELETLPLELEKIFKELEERIMLDIVRRIKINGEITRSADWQIYRLKELGKSKEEIEKHIQKTLKLSDSEINRLYDEVLKQDYVRDGQAYKDIGKPIIPFDENEQLKQLINATALQTKDEFKNITQSMGFAVKKGNNVVFKPIAKYYQETLDGAMLDITTGAFDYNTVLKRVVKEMTNSGLRTVDYASGWSNRVTAASRRAVMTGLGQLTGKINEDNSEQLGTEHFEVTRHIGARPSHQVWQGKVYKKEQLHSVCGLGTGPGLCGWNCYHNYYPFIPGISERTYTDEELEALNAKENTPVKYGNKEYTTYQATQQQRKLETTMRAQRQEIKLLEAGGADENDIINARAKYRVTSSEYVRFSKVMDLPQQRERVTIDGLKNIGQGEYKPVVEQQKTKDINNPTSINADFINSVEFKNKFKGIAGDEKTDDVIYQKAKDILSHRNNTEYEDMYLINPLSEKKVVGVQTHSQISNTITYNESLKRAIRNNPKNTLISIHNHPNSTPPSGSDIASNAIRGYAKGIVVCHNGDVYIYKAGKIPFTAGIFDRTVDKYTEPPYNMSIKEAYIKTLNQFKQDYGIEWEAR